MWLMSRRGANVPGVKAVWVNSPCNPTGEVYSAEQMAGIVAAAREIGAVVLSDECYALMQWRDAVNGAEGDADSLASTPCALRDDVCLGSAEGVLVLYSLSKQSNMAGYRTAFIAGDESLIASMSAYRKQIGQIIPGPVQAAMAAGLRDLESVKVQHARYRERLGVLVGALRAYGYCTDMPEGALYVWVRAKSGNCWTDMEQLPKIGIIASPASSTVRRNICASPPPPATGRSLPPLNAWRAKANTQKGFQRSLEALTCGVRGIRTLEPLKTTNTLAGCPYRPLRHDSTVLPFSRRNSM